MKPPKNAAATLDDDIKKALARFFRADPKKVAEAVAGDLLKQREEAKRRIEKVKKELQDGARPREGRFRL